MPLSKERNRNRMWWERYLSKQPWWKNGGMEGNEETMKATREAYARELSGLVPPLKDRTVQRYRHTMERIGH